jgi:heat shock protein HtpX
MPTAKNPWTSTAPDSAKGASVASPWGAPGAPRPSTLPRASGGSGDAKPGAASPSPRRQEDTDPEIGLAAERQALFAARAKGFDFRGAIAASGRRSFLLILGLTAAAILLGALLSGALIFGLLDQAHDGISGEEASWVLLGAIAFGVASLLLAWFRLRHADARILESQGAFEILPDAPATRADPLLRRLWNTTEEAALAAGLPMPRVFVIEDQALNAFAVGIKPRTAGVAATRGLLEALDREELAAVMAHEVAHIAQGDTRLMVTTAATAGMALVAVDLLRRIYPRGRSGAFIYLGALLLSFVVAAVVIPLVRAALSRQREYRADALAARLRRNSAGLASALARISENPRVARADHGVAELYILSPFGSSRFESLLATHPPTELRIARLLNLKAD